MSEQQYEEFLADLHRLRAALGLPSGALPISPREAFLECGQQATRLRAALKTFGQHGIYCGFVGDGQHNSAEMVERCTCGLDVALGEPTE